MTLTRNITNNDNIISSRDVVNRIDELENTLIDSYAQFGELFAGPAGLFPAQSDWIEDISNISTHSLYDEATEYLALKDLAAQCEGHSDWGRGATLIRDADFPSYVRGLAEETGAVRSDAPWPLNCIDWDKASRLISPDYATVNFDGEDYHLRA